MLKSAAVLGLIGLVGGVVPAAASYSHVVVVTEENRDFSDFIGNPASAPYINSVLVPHGTVLTNSLAIGHPSEPNYLQLFSGSAQGTQGTDGPVPGSLAPAGASATGLGLNTPNLGAAVQHAGGSYVGYSESLNTASDPLAYQAGGAGGALYARKHNPGSDFVAVNPTGNQLAATTNQDFTAFQATAFANLPSLAFIAPNQCNDAHGLTPDCPNTGAGFQTNISLADTFLRNNLDAYAQWALTHNSLLIVTTDEGNTTIGTDPSTGLPYTQVATIILGQGIRQNATYSGQITEYGLCAFIAGAIGNGAVAPANCGTPDNIAAAFALAGAIGANINVPEPASMVLLASGLAGAGLVRRRRA